MRHPVAMRRLLVLVVVAAMAGTAQAVFPGWRTALVSLGIVGAGGLVAKWLSAPLRAFSEPSPTTVDRLMARSAQGPVRPADLARLERALSYRSYSAVELDVRLMPILGPLASRRGIELDPTSLIGPDGRVTTARLAAAVGTIEDAAAEDAVNRVDG